MSSGGIIRAFPLRYGPLGLIVVTLLVGDRIAPGVGLAIPPPDASLPASRDEPHVCVIAPRVEVGPGGQAEAVVPLTRPTVFALGSYASMRIDREGQPPWILTPSDAGPIHGPVGWPLAPIRPGERLVVRLRPVGASPEDFASIHLIGASATTMRRSEELLRRLGDDPALWLNAVEKALANNDLPLAMTLLFAVEGPSDPELDALRMEVFRRGCDGGSSPP